MSIPPIRERTVEERLAYIEGFEAGWRYMLGCCWKGRRQSTAEAEGWCGEVTNILRRLEER